MRLLSTDSNEPAFLAVAQEAVGVIALGQSATGVVAIGQIARGIFVVGQGAIGIFGVGQLIGCVGWSGGMIGIGGRGWGGVLRVLPKYRADSGRPGGLPRATTLAQLATAGAVGAVGTVNGALRGGVLHVEGIVAGGELEALPAVTETLRAASPESELALVVEVGEREDPTEELDYRVAAAHVRTLTLVRAVPWKPWRWPFESMNDGAPASPGEMLLRLFVFTALVIGWLFAAGLPIADAVRGALMGGS